MWSRLGSWAALKNTLQALRELPADVAQLAVAVRDVRVATEATLAYVKRPRPRWAQILVLWNAPPRPAPVYKVPALELGEIPAAPPAPASALWATSTTEERQPRPAFHSISFDLNDEDVKRRGVCSQMDVPVPEGAWLVASGCVVHQVFVGAELQDVGSGIRGLPIRVLRLRDAIGVGVYLRCNVQPDEAE